MTAALLERIGKYQVLRLLGSGGMGRVYLARDPDIDREVAIKRVSLSADPQAQERFLREARTMGRLNHPNITTLLEFGMHEGAPFLVLELLSGEDLSQWMQRAHTLREQLQAMLDISRGLDAAHRAGILHRDLKPDNIRVLEDGRCKLLDFGIADTGADHLTASGYFVGTPEYVAPEVVSGEAHTASADLYALGLLFYVLLAGENPLRGETLQATVARVVQRVPPPLERRVSGVPIALCRIIGRCLSKEPDSRPHDAGELITVLECCLAETSAEQRVSVQTLDATKEVSRASIAPTALSAQLRQQRRRRWLWGVGAAAVLLAIALPLALRWSAEPTLPLAPAQEDRQPAQAEPASRAGMPDQGQEAAAEPTATVPPPDDSTRAETGDTREPELGEPNVGDPATTDPTSAAEPPQEKPVEHKPEPAPVKPAPQTPSSAPPVSARPATEPTTTPGRESTDITTADASADTSPVPAEPIPPATATVTQTQTNATPTRTELPPPPTATPIEVQVADYAPHVLRQGRSASVSVRGSGLAAVENAAVLIGGKVDERFRIGPLEHDGDDTLRFTITVERNVPHGNYALLLQGSTIRATPLMLRVGL